MIRTKIEAEQYLNELIEGTGLSISELLINYERIGKACYVAKSLVSGNYTSEIEEGETIDEYLKRLLKSGQKMGAIDQAGKRIGLNLKQSYHYVNNLLKQ